MGSIHRPNRDRKGPFPKRSTRKRSFRTRDSYLFFGVSLVAAAIVANSLGLLHKTSPRRLPVGLQVLDGNSLKVDGENIRLTGIDAPELHQTCRDAQASEWPCGQLPKRASPNWFQKGKSCVQHIGTTFSVARSQSALREIFPTLAKSL
jgi:hypothetical protein